MHTQLCTKALKTEHFSAVDIELGGGCETVFTIKRSIPRAVNCTVVPLKGDSRVIKGWDMEGGFQKHILWV